jgi:hypothetical protein
MAAARASFPRKPESTRHGSALREDGSTDAQVWMTELTHRFGMRGRHLAQRDDGAGRRI